MNIEQLDRLFSAVSRKHPVKTFIVMGSLTVLGLVNQRKIPDDMIVSVEVDAYPESDPARAFEIAEDFGLGSDFEQEYGYYFDAVSPALPTFPDEWEQRLIPYMLPGGTCLKFVEPHDAAIAKYARGAPKDLQWIRAGIDAGILSIATLEYRFRETVFADDPERERVRAAIGGEVARRSADPGPGDKRQTSATAPAASRLDPPTLKRLRGGLPVTIIRRRRRTP